MDDESILAVGKMVRLGETDLSYGFEFINSVDAADGSIKAYLTAVVAKPPVPEINVKAAIVTSPMNVVLADQKAGIMSWSAAKANDVSWRYKPNSIGFVSYDGAGSLILIEGDKVTMRLIDAKTGRIKASGVLLKQAIGEAQALRGSYCVPVKGSVMVLSADLSVKEVIQAEGLQGNARTYAYKGGVVIADADEILMIPARD